MDANKKAAKSKKILILELFAALTTKKKQGETYGRKI